MSFISYAQNFEDVVLWRALKHVNTGFYIDVGANDPDIDSVTRAFYERGWRGINIEPTSQWFQRLQEARERDINLQLAVGSESGEIPLYEIADTGLSTADISIAERHQSERGLEYVELTVPQETLGNICEQYHISPIHFLKIDVEGMEKAVLEGADFSKIRPWIVVVESTCPNSQKENYSEWEPILQNTGYTYVYSDGLNRFYLAEEHSELVSKFQYPPNYFDDFVPNKQLEVEVKLKNTVTHLKEVESELALVQAEVKKYQNEREKSVAEVKRIEDELGERKQALASKCLELQQEVERSQWLTAKNDELNKSSHHWWSVADGLNKELQSIYNGTFWRLTWPLRKVMQAVKAIFDILKNPMQWLKKVARWFLKKSITYVLRHDLLRYLAQQYLHRHPRLQAHLRAFARKRGLIPDESIHPINPAEGIMQANNDPEKFNELTPRARRIYTALKSAIEKKHGSTD